MNAADDLQRELAEFQHLREVRRLHSSKQLRIINDEAIAATDDLVRSEVRLIRALQAVDRLLVHRFLGYGSLFTYATGALKLSRAQSYAYVGIAKKSRELPKLLAAIECGNVSVSKAARLISVINKANQDQWLELAKSVTKRELERAIAEVNPESEGSESTEYLNGSRLRLKLAISEDLLPRLERARDVECQRQSKCLKLEDLLEVMVEEYLDRHDPVRRADRAAARGGGGPGRATASRGDEAGSRAGGQKCDPPQTADRATAHNYGSAQGSVHMKKQNLCKSISARADIVSNSDMTQHKSPVDDSGLQGRHARSTIENDESSEFLPGQTNSDHAAQCILTYDLSKTSDLATSCTRNDSGARAMVADCQIDFVQPRSTCLPGQTPQRTAELVSSTHMASVTEWGHPTRLPMAELKATNSAVQKVDPDRPRANQPRKPSQIRRRSPLPIHVKHAVHARDRGRCQHIMPDGTLCADGRFTDLHHIIPVYAGGLDELDNLTTLCQAHHRLMHAEFDGVKFNGRGKRH